MTRPIRPMSCWTRPRVLSGGVTLRHAELFVWTTFTTRSFIINQLRLHVQYWYQTDVTFEPTKWRQTRQTSPATFTDTRQVATLFLCDFLDSVIWNLVEFGPKFNSVSQNHRLTVLTVSWKFPEILLYNKVTISDDTHTTKNNTSLVVSMAVTMGEFS